jgi:Na+/melibiose symporter-like transporter
VAIQTAADEPPETIVWLGLVYGPIVAGFAVLSVYCYSNHQLDRHRHREIVEALARNRQEATDGTGRTAG